MKLLISLISLIFILSSCHQAPKGESKSIWKPYTQAALDDSIAHHIPIVIDFFATWCPNCVELDQTVFSRADIQAKLAQVTALRMDVTNQDDLNVQQIIQYYGIEGVPTVIFLDSHGHEIDNSRVIGYVTPEEFSQALAMFKIFK